MCLACLSHSQEYIKTGGQSQLECYDFLYEVDVKLQDDQWWMVLSQRSHYQDCSGVFRLISLSPTFYAP